MLTCQRERFAIPEDVVYLNCAYMSPILRHAAERGAAAVYQKQQPWAINPADFFPLAERSRALFGQLIEASADDIALVPAASYGIAVAARNLPIRAGQKIVLLAEQFPSNVYPWRVLAQETGARIETLPRPADSDWTRGLLAAIDDTTAIVACPHCHWTDGSLVDLVRVGERCRQVGAALVVDATQSLGVMPFSVPAIEPDFLVAASYKWLLGPYSYGYLYVAPRWQAGRPLEESWIARAGSENFARLVDYQDSYQPGARRFDVGERSNFMLTPVAVSALEALLEWGVDAISAYLGALTERVAERAQALGLQVAERRVRAPHLIGLRVPGGAPEELAARFAQEKVFVSVRGDAIRVGPHVYNEERDVARFFAVLEQALARPASC